MTELTVFKFQSNELRVIMIDEEPWFVLADSLVAMNSTTRPSDAKRSLIEELGEEVVTDYPLQTVGGIQSVLIISEPGLTFLVSRSRT